MAEQKERITYLDAVKVFALLMVFALHTQRGELVTEPCKNAVFFYAARCGMPLFFMVNGSVMLRRESFTFPYYRRKLAGIVRVLIINGICIGGYVLLVHHVSPLVAAREMFKGFLSYTTYAYLWFLYSFALIYTILLFGFNRIKKNLNRFLGVLCVVCLAVSLCSLASVMRGGFFVQEAVTQRLRLWTWLFYFCLGYKLSLIRINQGLFRILRWAVPVLAVIAVVWQYLLCYQMTGQIESNCMYDDAVIMLYCSSIFLWFRISPCVSAHFARFQSCSFGAFLIHGFLIDAFELRSAASGPLQVGLLWACLVVVCWTLAWLLDRVPVAREILRY